MGIYLLFENFNILGLYSNKDILRDSIEKYLFEYFSFLKKIDIKDLEEFKIKYKSNFDELIKNKNYEWDETMINIVYIANDYFEKKDNKYYLEIDKTYDFRKLEIKNKEKKKVITRSPFVKTHYKTENTIKEKTKFKYESIKNGIIKIEDYDQKYDINDITKIKEDNKILKENYDEDKIRKELDKRIELIKI